MTGTPFLMTHVLVFAVIDAVVARKVAKLILVDLRDISHDPASRAMFSFTMGMTGPTALPSTW
jgi:hypothetical protein